MSVSALIKQALNQGVHLYLKDDELAFQLKKGGQFSDALKQQIKAAKLDVIEFLRSYHSDTNSIRPMVTAREVSVNNEYPVSFAQQSLWFIDQLQDNHSANYNMFLALEVSGDFNVAVAEKSLHCIIERHEILRTIYRCTPEGPVQFIQDVFDFHIDIIDLTSLQEQTQSRYVDDLLNEKALKSFNLSADLMLSVSWLQLANKQGVLVFNVHHIAADGWSEGILINEFIQLFLHSMHFKKFVYLKFSFYNNFT